MATSKAVTVLWLLLMLQQLARAVRVLPQTQCQNGGTFDKVAFTCICTPYFYGGNCETAFSNSDPCADPSIQELVDSSGSHGPGNTQPCSATGGCIDYSTLNMGWYRIKSPAGNSLTTSCPSTIKGCGSSYPFFVTDIVQEDNANRQLYSARLSRVLEYGTQCYSPTELYYPVRILFCASFQLYFLGPTMIRDHHYCIGNKKLCTSGLVSLDGGGYEPCYNASLCIPTVKPGAMQVPVLQQIRNNTSVKFYESIFNCSIQDAFETNFTKGLSYKVTFRLTYHNFTRIIIPECTANNLTLSPGGRATVSCHYGKILIPHSNIYGGMLECVLQAKCNADTSDYMSQELISLPHRFEFQYNLLDGSRETSVLTPSSPIMLCINITKVPIIGSVEFRITARREAIVSDDKISLNMVPQQTNETVVDNDLCAIKFQGMLTNYTTVCTTLTLINEDEEGLIVRGLDGKQMVPLVDIGISYRSKSSSGVYTANEWIKTQSRQMIVDISSLYASEIKDYLHVYSDPFVKPANSDQIYMSLFYHDGCRVLSLMRHKVLPYEIQAKECNTRSANFHSVITQVAIRYEYYLIEIYSTGRTLNVNTKKLERSALPLKADNTPRGVTVEKASNGVRVKLDIYGTLIYVWGFITNAQTKTSSCVHSFIQSRKSMIENPCFFDEGNIAMDSYDALDLMIIPGFFDTQSRIDGLMYRSNYANWEPADNITIDSSRDMFSKNFVAERVSESLLKPTSTLDLCRCYENDLPASLDTKDRCVIKQSGDTRTKRSTMPTLSRPVRSVAFSSGYITTEIAAQECEKYIQSQMFKKAKVVSECSLATGIHGSLDYMTKFKTVCIQYATQLNTMNYAESIFNSIAGQCITSLSYNVSYIKSSASTLQQMLAQICPNNCSGNGECISGACWCHQGYSGSACEVKRDVAVINDPGPAKNKGILLGTSTALKCIDLLSLIFPILCSLLLMVF